MIGKTVSHYKIIDKLGEGGMGEVYLAEDLKLERKVALKLLQREAIGNEEAKERFHREAKAASALNHRNITTVYEIDRWHSYNFISMEYVAGNTLKEMVEEDHPHKNSITDIIDYALQICSALQAAHEKDIVHRDIKSDNIMINENGEIKVMDFGLAKFKEVSSLTKTGSTVGTVSYMSPEQARGDSVDHRSDIWSLGVVLYEIITGELPFKADYEAAVIYLILNQNPKNVAELRTDVPNSLATIIKKCLEKNVINRYQHIKEVIADLRKEPRELVNVRRELFETIIQRGILRKGVYAVLSILAAIFVLIIISIFNFDIFSDRSLPQKKPIPLTNLEESGTLLQISPDGRQIAFTGKGSNIFTCQIATGAALQLTENAGMNWWPVWSADGNYIAFGRYYQGVRSIHMMTSFGGREKKLINIRKAPWWGIPANWFPDGKSLAFTESDTIVNRSSIILLSLDHLDRHKLTYPPPWYFDTNPVFSPDGKKLAFVRGTSVRSGNIFILELKENETRQITFGNKSIAGLSWTPDSRDIVFSSNIDGGFNSIWRVSESGGSPEPVQYGGSDDLIYPTISLQGNRLVYAQESETLSIWQLYLKKAGENEIPSKRIITSVRHNSEAEYSPDGNKIVFTSSRTGNEEIWISDSDGQNEYQLTFLNAEAGAPAWSFPDGQWIIFELNIDERQNIYKVRAEGGSPVPMTQGKFVDRFPAWSRDGKWIYFLSNRSGEFQIWKIPALEGEAEQVTFNGAWSRGVETVDRKWLYYSKRKKGLYRMSLDNNEEEQFIDHPLSEDHWALAKSGIYYTFMQGDSLNCIAYYDLKSKKVIRQYEISNNPVHSLAISPDQNWLLYSEEDHIESTIMLIENFR